MSENVPLSSNRYLCEHDFIKVLTNSTYQDHADSLLQNNVAKVISKISECPYFCIAGGSMTQCFLHSINHTTSSFHIKSSSDIDVFVLGGIDKNNSLAAFRTFVAWLKTEFGPFRIEIRGKTNSVITLLPEEESIIHPIQFVLTKRSLMEVLYDFDNSHRCGIYLGKSYICPDVNRTLLENRTMITYFYSPQLSEDIRKH